MNKRILKLILPLILLTFLSAILIPYFTERSLNLRLRKENEIIYQKILKEKIAKKEAEEKIYLMGKFDPAEREDFILVPIKYTTSGNKMYLRKETFEAYLKMQESADEDEVELKIASATRNFDYQKNIWNKKWEDLSKSIPDGLGRFKKILEYSAAPGTSRHHWGTDIDINGAEPAYFNSEKGKKEYEWLVKNAPAFGFCQTYKLKGTERETGYNEEKWHWSYLPPSKTFMQEYKKLIKNENIKGFLGDEFVAKQDLISNYVFSINPECI